MAIPNVPGTGGVSEDDIRDGGGFYYVAREILVNVEDEPLVADALTGLGAERVVLDSGISRYVVLYRLRDETRSVPEVVEQLRALPVVREPRVGPNHVMAGSTAPSGNSGVVVGGQPNYHGGPGGAPIPVQPQFTPVPPATGGSTGNPVTVAILDTGVDPKALQLPLLQGRFHPDPLRLGVDDVYLLNQPGQIDLMGGHGTMVAGIIARHAPDAMLLPVKVLSPAGLGTEVGVFAGIDLAVQRGARVINLSLGGYVMPGRLPTLMDPLLTNLDNRVSVVAAAGNYGSREPFYPASHGRVVGVGALSTTILNGLAGFSNRGSWVSAGAPGERIYGLYVTGVWAHDGTPREFDGRVAWSGTSFAAPHVAAVIAARTRGDSARVAEFALLPRTGPRDPDYGVRVVPPNVAVY